MAQVSPKAVRRTATALAGTGQVAGKDQHAEQRAAAEFIAGLQRAGVDPTKPGACDEIQVSPLVAAGILGIKRQTLALWRCTRSQPLRYVKVGRRVSYRLGDLRRFTESRAQLPVQAA